jgi:PKD repeat protein
MTPRSTPSVLGPTVRLALVSALFSILVPATAQDQGFLCGNNTYSRLGHLVNGHPERVAEIEQAREELEAWTAHYHEDADRGGDDYIIPVVFHIIHNNGLENISDAQVEDAVRLMNEDFNQQNPDWDQVQPEFLDVVGDVGVTFKLAQKDPDGNCTNGITRTVSTLTYEGNQDMKDLIQWPRNRYLNIWVSAGAGGAAGYSMYPSSVAGAWGAPADGIVVLADYVGSIGTSQPSHAHTLSHEAGHWLNLMHCWGDSNEPGTASNCNIDDGVADTPNTEGWASCFLSGATCGSAKDNVENFMEYSYCSKMFTQGQATRVHAALNSGTAQRNNLWTVENLSFTGVNDAPELCSVQFTGNKRVICQGGTVTFTDDSYNGVSQWEWSFSGGTPATSTEEGPVVTYDTPGTYDVSLTVGNGNETESTTQTQYVQVLPEVGTALPFQEGFEEGTSLSAEDWMISDMNGDGSFAVNTSAGYNSAHSVRLQNGSSFTGKVDELLSTPLDGSMDPPMILSFRYAFAKRYTANDDALRVYLSFDCGVNWSLRKTMVGDALATAPNTTSPFTPNGPEQWGYYESTPIGTPYDVSNLRIKFRFESDGGNNLWLDDINLLGASTGVTDLAAAAGELEVYPNPGRDELRVSVFLTSQGAMQLELLDLLGRPVKSMAQESRPAGAATWELSVQDVPAGMYLVRLRSGDGVRTVKWTKD